MGKQVTGSVEVDKTMDVDLTAALGPRIARRLGETCTPGALVGVWGPSGREWVYSAGIGDLDTAAPVNPLSHVRIASISKTFVATVILQLVDEGKLSLNDPIASFVSGIPHGETITIRQMLGMTSGVFDFTSDPKTAAAYEADPLLDLPPAKTLEMIRSSTPDFAPGERVAYSNSNYILAGFIIEAVTGHAATTEISDRLLKPLGLDETSFPETPELPEPFMRGYFAKKRGDRLIDVTRSNPAVAWTAGAMVSTLADLRTWAIALANGALVSPEMHAAQFETRPFPMGDDDSHQDWLAGYGLGVMTLNGLIGHAGGIPGYSSWLLHAPEEEITVVVVTNRAAETGGSGDAVLEEVLPVVLPNRFSVRA